MKSAPHHKMTQEASMDKLILTFFTTFMNIENMAYIKPKQTNIVPFFGEHILVKFV